MSFIKEFCPESKTVVIRSNTYGSSMQMFMDMVDEARKDFDVDLDTCKVVHYGGNRYARTFGIEFPSTYAPEDYYIIHELEYTK